jgi:hypothetical protein
MAVAIAKAPEGSLWLVDGSYMYVERRFRQLNTSP